MNKGEIWIIEVPNIGGHEQYGKRPAIIIADTKASVVLVIPCTSNIEALRFPYTIRIKPSAKNGLEVETIALVLQLRAIDRQRLQHKIGFIDGRLLKDIDGKLCALLKL